MSKSPLIGIPLDWLSESSYAPLPHYVIKEDYFPAIIKASGLPVGLPYDVTTDDAFVELVDGLLVPGGDFLYAPSDYVDVDEPDNYTNTSIRLEANERLLKKFLQSGKPVLGICAGHQELARIHGSKFYKNISKAFNTQIQHRKRPYTLENGHEVIIEKGTLLHKIIGAETMRVNTFHNEAIAKLPATLKVSAKAPDGVIEAIEIPNHKFAIGVQWHPEMNLDDPANFKIFTSFIEACRGK